MLKYLYLISFVALLSNFFIHKTYAKGQDSWTINFNISSLDEISSEASYDAYGVRVYPRDYAIDVFYGGSLTYESPLSRSVSFIVKGSGHFAKKETLTKTEKVNKISFAPGVKYFFSENANQSYLSEGTSIYITMPWRVYTSFLLGASYLIYSVPSAKSEEDLFLDVGLNFGVTYMFGKVGINLEMGAAYLKSSHIEMSQVSGGLGLAFSF